MQPETDSSLQSHKEDPTWISSLSQSINKTKALIRLEIDSLQKQDNIESISQANFRLITHLFKAFKMIRQSTKDKTKQQMKQKIQEQIKKCDKFIKLTQIRMIDTVQSIIKGLQNEKIVESVQDLYQQFYIYCSQYMNKEYEYSNKLCMLLSQQAQAPSKVSLTIKTDVIPQTASDSSLLKILQQKITRIKKNYQNQILIRQRQVLKYEDQIQYYQTQLQNLVNERDELIQDINQFQQAVEKGSLQQAQQILQSINQNKSKERRGKVKNKTIQKVKLATDQLKKQIQQFEKANLNLKEENLSLRKKLQEYKVQIHRSGWVISVQSREIMLNEQKLLQYQEKQQKSNMKQVLSQNKNLYSSNLSFNPNSTLGKSNYYFGELKNNNLINIQNNYGSIGSQHSLKRTSYDPAKLSSLDQVFAKVKTPIKFFNYKKEA